MPRRNCLFHEYDMVKLVKSFPEKQLDAGALGAILLVLNMPGLPLAYEVELTNNTDKVVLLTLFEDDFELESETSNL